MAPSGIAPWDSEVSQLNGVSSFSLTSNDCTFLERGISQERFPRETTSAGSLRRWRRDERTRDVLHLSAVLIFLNAKKTVWKRLWDVHNFKSQCAKCLNQHSGTLLMDECKYVVHYFRCSKHGEATFTQQQNMVIFCYKMTLIWSCACEVFMVIMIMTPKRKIPAKAVLLVIEQINNSYFWTNFDYQSLWLLKTFRKQQELFLVRLETNFKLQLISIIIIKGIIWISFYSN